MNEENKILLEIDLTGTESNKAKVAELNVELNKLYINQQKIAAQNGQGTQAYSDNARAIENTKKEIVSLNKEIAKTATLQEAEEGSLTQLRIALSKATAEYNRMGEVKRNSVKGKELETSIINQTQAISALEQKMGNFRRNVGNYASGWNGLSNSINQVTRELPNFAQSATIGFMALSNNLPILVDEINRVRVANAALAADGQKTTSVFKQIATSLFSWQSALITVISLSVMYGKEIGNFITGTKEATKVTKERKTAQDMLNESMKNFATLLNPVNYQTLTQVLQMLRGDNNKALVSTNELRNALANLNTQMNNLKIYKKEIAGVTIVEQRDIDHYNTIKKNILENIALVQAEIDKREGKSQKTKDSNDKSVKAEEDYQKELLALVEQYHDLRIETMTDKNQQELYNEYEKHHRIIDALKVEATDNEQIVKQKNRNIEQEQKRHEKEMLRIVLSQGGNKAVDPTAEEAKRFDDATKLLDKKARERYEKRQKTDKEIEDKNRKLAIDAAINAAKQTVDAISQIKQQELDRQLKRELTAIQRQSDGQDAILKHRLENGLITEATYAFEKQKLNEETAAKELEANRKMFEEKKRLDTATAIANGALAITSILAQYPKFDYGIAAAIAIGAATATTATQVAVIQAQKFALGGKVQGKSHAQGGVMIEAEGGEGMINKNSMRSNQVMQVIGTPSQIASAINTTGGGVSWETGATLRPNPNMFSNNSLSQSITYSQMAALLESHASKINDKKVILLESDVTKTQNKVKTYESASKF